MPLSKEEKELCEPLIEGPRLISKNGEVDPRVKRLIAEGYIRLVDALSGPLRVKTGEKMATLTEAGKIAFESQRKK